MRRSCTGLDLFQIVFEITATRLNLADCILNLAFQRHGLVADNLAGNFLDLAFHFLDAALDLILVHFNLQCVNEGIHRW